MDARTILAFRVAVGLDMTPRSYNEHRDLLALAHRWLQYHEMTLRDVVRLYLADRRHR